MKGVEFIRQHPSRKLADYTHCYSVKYEGSWFNINSVTGAVWQHKYDSKTGGYSNVILNNETLSAKLLAAVEDHQK